MTQEEKAKAYDEALTIAKRIISKNCSEVEKLCLKSIFPELAESEDERVRKNIIENVRLSGGYTDEEIDEMISWLEKQKEQKQEWKPEPESLEALMYAIEGKWDRISPTSYLSRRLEDLYEGLVNTFNVDESLIAELPKVASRAYTAEDIEELRELKHKIEASMEQKPAEWSEENYDKISKQVYKAIRRALASLAVYAENEALLDSKEETLSYYSQQCAEKILKSLRPSWKPSEEDNLPRFYGD